MRERGFSLLEIIVVLVLLSLSIALIAPSLSRFSKSVELKSAAKRIAAILRYYRSEAIHKGKVYQVLFDSDLKEVRVRLTESTEAAEGEEPKETQEFQKTYRLPSDVQMKEVKTETAQYPSDVPAIEFYPNGGSNGGNIHLNTETQGGYKIKINFLTGTVAIERV